MLILGSRMDPVALPHVFFFFFNDPATTEIYTLSLHDALPISGGEWSWTELVSACVGPWLPPQCHREKRGSGRGSGEIEALFQTGSGGRLSPVVSPRAPGTNLTNGHKAPRHYRSRPPATICAKDSTGSAPSSFRLSGGVAA